MKRVEKLAKDYYVRRPEGFGEPTSDFEAGYRAALGDAAKEAIIQGEKLRDADPIHAFANAMYFTGLSVADAIRALADADEDDDASR